MKIGVLKEAHPGETRVAATPTTVEQLHKLGYQVVVETGAGGKSNISDQAYRDAGAVVAEAGAVTRADIVFGVNAPAIRQLDGIRPGATLVSLLQPALRQDLLDQLAGRSITALAMDAVPRISRAQSLDVLSSMANIAGYRAVIEAAHSYGRFFTGQVTAAGKVPPTKVLIAGAGVAGLAAIGTASSLGAIVRATDPRQEVADQVKSLGGEYLSVASSEASASVTGYAKEMSDDYSSQAAALYARQCREVDIVITTALIPGKPAPRLITADMVASMRAGSVIVDMAAANGGNVEGTVAGEVVVTDNGVTIIGYTDLAGRLPAQASQLYATNLVNLMKLLTPGNDGIPVLDWDDVVLRSMTVVRDGEVTWPPPPVKVSVSSTPPEPVASTERAPESVPPHRHRNALIGAGGVCLFGLAAIAPAGLAIQLTVFALAIVVGFYVIGSVHHALHTPLMSVTNAISGIIVVGALTQIGYGGVAITVLASIAVLVASINIFGGFAVTRRMLAMFSRS